MKIKTIKQNLSLLLSCVLILTNVANTYALSSIRADKNINITARETSQANVVYLKNGEGSLTIGNGTVNNPYQNIRTALKNIKNGQTLKLVGTVSYTKYEVDNEKAPLPLMIDKNIIIEGSSGKLPTDVDADGLVVRAPIQLGANVTFKNIKLQLVPQVVLGAGGRQNILGAQSPMAATIFAAGNTLTLDNVNTKVGTNSLQDKDRPYISGGTYKNNGTLGKKSVINIINPNSQTKFAAIYAGDYWNDRNIDVEINLNSSVLNNKIYTGGFSKKLTGNVSVRLGDKSNIYSFDKTNHSGNLNVTVDKDSYMDNLDINGIDELTLDENAKVILKKGSDLNIKNINIKKDSVLDLRKGNNLNLKGNLTGANNVNNAGCVLIASTQTLNISNEVIGITKLNHLNTIYSQVVANNHQYVKANKSSNGDFVLDNIVHRGYILEKNISGNNKIWTVVKGNNIFKDFIWGSEYNEIIKPSKYKDYDISLSFINDKGANYIPYNQDWDDFEFTLKKADGTILDEYSALDDMDICFIVNYLSGEITLNILNENYEGTVRLSVKNKVANKSAIKDIIISKEKIVEPKPEIHNKPEEKPNKVSGIKATSNSYNSIKLTWNKTVNGANGYAVYRSTSKDGKYTLRKTITSKNTIEFTDTGLDTNTTYYYKVRPYRMIEDKKEYGSYSEIVCAKPVLSKTTITVSSTSKKATIKWNKVLGASGYKVYSATSSDGTYSLKKTITSINTLSYTNTNLVSGKTYYYKVRAYRNVNGKVVYGPYSAVKSKKIK
ncbi:fibronectin type III domain-containing protein [Intestinibacter bartlettii]|uniref:fibronectin type III domain-containing protein n=1 Tax=Intestinibacter bartlettii TaxID=261299 RepID=UPI00241E0C61|nr:fibronectin type III domain-containing protein [Intestinibacter bartlettii]MDU6472556.1 fibronectin type III domain-containing protein [Intestinibacter bartlettii]